MSEEIVTDYAADSDVTQPKKKGRKVDAAPVTTVEDAPPVAQDAGVYLSPQTLLEMEAGRKAIGK